MEKIIPYGHQSITDEDIQAVVNVLKGDYLTQGPVIETFEKSICDYTGAKYCVAVSNGTAALHIAVAALDLPVESEGITTPITFTASANAMAFCNVKPCFADIDPQTFCLNPDAFELRTTKHTRLVMPVHFAGRVCDMIRIHEIASSRGIYIIEDAAHAIGSDYPDGGKIGSCKYSDLTIFSFHPVKTITTGEGGAVTTNDPELYQRLLYLRSHGITKDVTLLHQNLGPWYYEMHCLGYNYRMTEMQGALGVSQIKRLDVFKKRRLEIIYQYNDAFKFCSWLQIPNTIDMDCFCYHLYVLRFDWQMIGLTRVEVMAKLREQGILTQVHYIPVHTQPFYQEKYGTLSEQYLYAESFYEHALSIPLYPDMTDVDVKRVIIATLNLSQEMK